jgi:hypothetical protein
MYKSKEKDQRVNPIQPLGVGHQDRKHFDAVSS